MTLGLVKYLYKYSSIKLMFLGLSRSVANPRPELLSIIISNLK